MELLRFFTAGNVDDGKSTLIGRLLYDSQSISTDILETLTQQSKITGTNATIDLALLTDGLRAEREQGITIDVAYKYFSTAKRKFIIADTPGHVQYTRNMFTGASNADLAIILVDARNGITEQTKRHTIIASLLRIPKILLCVNKMDMVDYDEKRFNEIKEAYTVFVKPLSINDIAAIPTSALAGENVVSKSEKMPWYTEAPLLSYLENVQIEQPSNSHLARFQVQYVIRPQQKEFHDYRAYAGQVLSGSLHVAQEVYVLPQMLKARIAKLEINQEEVDRVFAPQAVAIQLDQQLEISRGNSIVPADNLPQSNNVFEASICWMDDRAYVPGQKFILQQGSFCSKAKLDELLAHIDIHSFEDVHNKTEMELNDLCKVRIKTAEPISYDSFHDNKVTGAFILINENTRNTVAAGMIH